MIFPVTSVHVPARVQTQAASVLARWPACLPPAPWRSAEARSSASRGAAVGRVWRRTRSRQRRVTLSARAFPVPFTGPKSGPKSGWREGGGGPRGPSANVTMRVTLRFSEPKAGRQGRRARMRHSCHPWHSECKTHLTVAASMPVMRWLPCPLPGPHRPQPRLQPAAPRPRSAALAGPCHGLSLRQPAAPGPPRVRTGPPTVTGSTRRQPLLAWPCVCTVCTSARMARLWSLWLVAALAAASASAQVQRYPATQYPIYYAHTPAPPQAALPLQVTGYSGASYRASEQQPLTPQQQYALQQQQQQQQYEQQYLQQYQQQQLAAASGQDALLRGLQPVHPSYQQQHQQQQPLTPEQVALREAQSQAEWIQTVDGIIARGVLELSLSLAKAVEEDGDVTGQVANVVFSPVNVAAALALVLAGSNGTTFSEIANVLGIATGVNVLGNRERVHREFGRFLNQLETDSAVVKAGNSSGGNQVIFANGLFVQNEYKIQPQFAGIAEAYHSQVVDVEFAREPGRTKDKINNWFSTHTKGRIRSVLSEAPPTDTKLMIASALFFNGEWEAPFPSEATMTRPFYGVSANTSLEAFAVRMMTNNMELPFAEDRRLGCRLLELPYKGRDVSMFLVLPDAQGLDELRALERRLTSEALDQLIDARKDAPVIYSVPRMKLERSISLRTALETLGVRSLFDESLADLTLLSDSVVQRSPVAAGAAPASPAAPAAAAPGAAAPGKNPATTSKGPATTSKGPVPAAAQPAASQPAAAQSASAQPAPTQSAQQARPKPTTRRPVGENAIGPENNFYFSSRISDMANSPQMLQQQQAARLYADDVLHKVEVEVTETGTVASAATAITISRDGSNHVMRFNRPFLFFIRHNATKLVLFYGSVVRPMPDWIVPGVDVSHLPPNKPGGHRRPPPPQQQQQQPATTASPSQQGRRPTRQHQHAEATSPRPGANG